MLSDAVLMAWARAADEWYCGNSNPEIPAGLRVRDVELAADVGTLIVPMFFIVRFLMGAAPDARMGRPGHPLVCVEIGTADGSTALPILKAVAEVGGHLHSVDPSECEDAHLLVDTFGYRSHWTHHKMPSDHFFEGFHSAIDFGFVDGDHRWPVVERDLRNLYERLRPGGLIWASDYDPLPEGAPPYAHEHDGSAVYEAHVGGDVFGERQASRGVAKAAHRAVPSLPRAQSFHLPQWPNSSLLIRKMVDGELDPAKPFGEEPHT